MAICIPKTFQTSDNESLSVEERADRYVRRLQGFYVHLAAYVGVNAGLVVINLLTSPDVFWALWPILGWGVKVGMHAVTVFGVPGYANWKARVRRDYFRCHTDRPASDVGGPTDEPSEDTEQLRQRVENLEAIVTSADWDLLADLEGNSTSHERAAALADEVVPR